MSTEIKSSDPCPLCLLQNKQSNPLMNRPGQFYTNCKAGHRFEDTDELNMLRQQARAKYPNLYRGPEQPIPVDPAQFANSDIVISAEVKKSIEELCGFTFTGSADLKGTIFAFVQDNKDKDLEIRSLRTSMAAAQRGAAAGARKGSAALGIGQVVNTIPEWALEGAMSQAEYAGMGLEEWVSQEFDAWLQQYFGVGPGQQVAH